MIKPIPVMDPARVRWGFRALALGLLAALPACDNPACLYAPNGCQDGGGSGSGGGVGSQPASLPEDGVWILPSAPTLDQVQPVGSNVNPGAPVVLFFSESMNPATFSGALQILETSTGSQVPTIQPPPVVGDGRVVILAPALPLTEGGSYVVQLREGALLTDITGQPMIEGATSQLAQFTVTTNPDDSATGKLVINGQTYGMEFADKGAITVTCANGKVEKYAVEKDLCAPLELDECEKGGNGGGPICAPLFSCGPNDTCPVGYTCEPALSACLKQCAPGGPCPACQTCSKSDNLCHPGSGPPPP